MGKTMMGSTEHKKNVSMLTPEQQRGLSEVISNLSPTFTQSLMDLMMPMSEEEKQNLFQQTYVEPAKMAMERQIAPALQQRFVDADAGSSSALNQALAQASADLSTTMGAQYGQYLQNLRNQQLQASSMFPGLLTNQTFTPLIQQTQGLAGPLISAAGQIAGGAFGGLR